MVTEKLKIFSKEYKTEVNNRLNHNMISYQLLVNEIPGDIKSHLINSVLNMENLKKLNIEGSIGRGNTTHYPWIGIFDERVSTGATNGFYVVFLISDDFEDVYLTLNQGATEQTQETVERYRNFVYECVPEIDGFQKGQLPCQGSKLFPSKR